MTRFRIKSVFGNASVSPIARRLMYSADHGPIPFVSNSARRKFDVSCASESEIAPLRTRRLNSRIACRRAIVVFTALKSQLARTLALGNKCVFVPDTGSPIASP